MHHICNVLFNRTNTNQNILELDTIEYIVCRSKERINILLCPHFFFLNIFCNNPIKMFNSVLMEILTGVFIPSGFMSSNASRSNSAH